MLKIAKIAIICNFMLSLLYVISDYVLWSIIGGESWSYYGAVASWSPLYVTPVYPMITGSRPYNFSFSTPVPLLNIPFLLFLVMFATNLYFIIKISKESKRQTQTNGEIHKK
jgi:hypothetical protein